MNKNILLTVVVCSFINLTGAAQSNHFSIDGSVVYGKFKMQQAKDFQRLIAEDAPVEMKTMSEFPAFYGFQGKLTYKYQRVSFNAGASFISSGSRLSYQDYTGSLSYTQQAQILTFGAGAEFQILRNEQIKWQPFVYINVSWGTSKFNVNQSIIIQDSFEEADVDFDAKHFMYEPGVGVKRDFLKHFYGFFRAGYLVDEAKDLTYVEDRSLFLYNGPDHVSLDWSGVRLGLGVGAYFVRTH